MFDVLIPTGLRDVDLGSLRFFGVDRALVLDEITPVASADALSARWTALCTHHLPRLRRAGIEASAALSVGVSLLPASSWDAALRALPELLLRDDVSAIGPLELPGAPSQADEALVAEQFALCRRLRRRALVSASTTKGLRRVLGLAQAARLHPAQVVVLGVRGSTVKLITGRGHSGIVVVRSDLASADEAIACVRTVGPRGLMFGSTAGAPSAELLAAPRALQRLASSGVTGAVVRNVASRNAAEALPMTVASTPSKPGPPRPGTLGP